MALIHFFSLHTKYFDRKHVCLHLIVFHTVWHIGTYEEHHLLGCKTMKFGRSSQTFWMNTLSHPKTMAGSYQTTWCYNPEDCTLWWHLVWSVFLLICYNVTAYIFLIFQTCYTLFQNMPLTLTSMLSTPLPIRTIILNVLNFSRSSFVRIIVCHMRAPTASFRTWNIIMHIMSPVLNNDAFIL